MEGVDIGVLAILFLPAVMGLMYGLLNIMFSIAAWILSAALAIKFSSYFSPLLAGYFDDSILRDIIAFAGIFVISLVIFSTLGYFIVRLLGRAGLTVADRLLGSFFGFGLGAAIITVVVFLAGFTAISEKNWWQNSIMLEPFQRVCIWGRQYLPENISVYHRYEPGNR